MVCIDPNAHLGLIGGDQASSEQFAQKDRIGSGQFRVGTGRVDHNVTPQNFAFVQMHEDLISIRFQPLNASSVELEVPGFLGRAESRMDFRRDAVTQDVPAHSMVTEEFATLFLRGGDAVRRRNTVKSVPTVLGKCIASTDRTKS